MRKTSVIIFLLCLTVISVQAQEVPDFQTVNKNTYELFEAGKWKELTVEAKKALRQGVDYFYLRLRNGLAYYHLGKYDQAVIQLSAAREFNPWDRTTSEYLYYSYLMLNKTHEALVLLNQIPESLRDYLLQNYPPYRGFIHVDPGFFFSDQDRRFRNEDLDGDANVYGETDIFNWAHYISAGGRWFLSKNFSGYIGYTYLYLNKNKLFMTGNSIILDKSYHTDQNQVYFSGTIYPGGRFVVVPAFHFINFSQVSPAAVYDSSNSTYNFHPVTLNMSSYIGYCSMSKDYSIVKAGIFGAIANLNHQDQYQAGFDLLAFPLGNLDLYLHGQFVAHFNEGDLQPVVNGTVGTRILKPIWIEASGTFGRVDNYFEKNASAVYNFPDRMRFKYGLHLVAMASKRINLSLDYQFLGKQAVILNYVTENISGTIDYIPEQHFKNYTDHFLIASLLWKL